MLYQLSEVPALLTIYSYPLLFIITVIEGPIISVVAGFLCAHGIMNIYFAYVVVVLGDLVGDVFYYSLGRWGSRNLLKRWGGILGMEPESLDKLEKHFAHHAGKTIFISKIAHGIGAVFLMAAGTSKMDLKKFIWYNFLGTLPKSLLLVLIGYFFGSAFSRISEYFDTYGFFILGLAILILIIYVLFSRFAKSKV